MKSINGINMTKYIKDFELELEELAQYENIDKYKIYIIEKIKWIQHERLIHLLVTLFTLGVFIFFITLINYFNGVVGILVLITLMILNIFYIRHYFILENTIQRIYKLSESLL